MAERQVIREGREVREGGALGVDFCVSFASFADKGFRSYR